MLLQVTNHPHFYLLGEPYTVSRLLNIRLLIALSALICTVLCGLLSLFCTAVILYCMFPPRQEMLPPDLPVSDTELSILFGNLLENDWEA